MQRELATFPLAPIMKSKLSGAGFQTVEDVCSMKPSELSKILGIDPPEALDLQQQFTPTECPNAGKPQPSSSIESTAWDLLQAERRPAIVSFCESLDELIGGGVPCGKMTEFAGAPGVGKTQLCIQLSVDVQIPECFGGVEGEAFYIDTEGSFMGMSAIMILVCFH